MPTFGSQLHLTFTLSQSIKLDDMNVTLWTSGSHKDIVLEAISVTFLGKVSSTLC